MSEPILAFWVPVGSLIVAVLAVFFGPLISLLIARRESDTSLKVAKKHIVAPLRQAWIDGLRSRVAEIIGKAHSFNIGGREAIEIGVDLDDIENQGAKVDRELSVLITQIELMLNPQESDHVDLLTALREVRRTMWPREDNIEIFRNSVRNAISVCQAVLKREWVRVKNEF